VKDNFSKLCTENKLICSDDMRLDKAFAFCGDNENVVSWIDHILCSVAIDNTVSRIEVLHVYDYILSDHKPLSVMFDKLVGNDASILRDNDLSSLNIVI